jgi:hypothetical protein
VHARSVITTVIDGDGGPREAETLAIRQVQAVCLSMLATDSPAGPGREIPADRVLLYLRIGSAASTQTLHARAIASVGESALTGTVAP